MQTDDIERAGYEWLFRWHDEDITIIAKICGVSVRTVQRWKARRAIPRSKALLIEQIKNGPALRFGAWRSPLALRREYRQ